MVALVAGAAMLHLLHAAAGHRALATFGPIVAGLVAVGLACLPHGDIRWDTRMTLAAAVLMLLLGGEWLESELIAGHALASALRDHGRIVAAALGAAAGIAALLQASRTLDTVLDAFATRRR